MIWLSLLLPLFTVIVLAVFFKKKIVYWEYLIIVGIPIIVILIAKYSSIISQTNTKEIWNSYLVSAIYEEEWDEWIHKTCTRCVRRDSTGCIQEENYDCSYREYHPPQWYTYDNIGKTYHISSVQFEDLCKLWGNRTFKDMNRHYHRIDGDAYTAQFDNNFDHIKPVVSVHTYENKVKCSKSVFNYQEVRPDEKSKYGLYDYPAPMTFNYNPILGWNDKVASEKMQKYNAKLGSLKQVHMLLLVFHDQPVLAGALQEAYWKGGNKNEFILCVGLDGKEISWTKVISWTDNQLLKTNVARVVKDMNKFDAVNIIDFMSNEVNRKFVRKQFKDFDYLTVEPSTQAIVITFSITFLLCIGLSIFVVANDFEIKRHEYY